MMQMVRRKISKLPRKRTPRMLVCMCVCVFVCVCVWMSLCGFVGTFLSRGSVEFVLMHLLMFRCGFVSAFYV